MKYVIITLHNVKNVLVKKVCATFSAFMEMVKIRASAVQ